MCVEVEQEHRWVNVTDSVTWWSDVLHFSNHTYSLLEQRAAAWDNF